VDEREIERLHRRLRAREYPQAVMALPNEKFTLVPFDSPRFHSMLADQRWSSRVLGVFSQDVEYSVLCAEVL